MGEHAGFTEHWSPKIIAQMDDYQFKLAKLKGDFVWHSLPQTDEAFLVLEGQLRAWFKKGSGTVAGTAGHRPKVGRVLHTTVPDPFLNHVTLDKGEMLIVPKGVEHKPFAGSECHVLVIVRVGTVNTGDAPENDLTADSGAWI